MFEKCNNCGTRLITGKRDQNGIFCSTACQNFYRCPGFCQWCDADTTPKSAGSTFTMNGIGTSMYGSKSPCPKCGSIIKIKWLVVFFIPVIPLGKYRFKWVTRGRYISRKLKPAGAQSSEPKWVGQSASTPLAQPESGRYR
jgi:endogenous inhibitor of DNA gyrase (YacG/DUF329 family)